MCRRPTDFDPVLTVAAEDQVVASLAVELITARTADQDVVAIRSVRFPMTTAVGAPGTIATTVTCHHISPCRAATISLSSLGSHCVGHIGSSPTSIRFLIRWPYLSPGAAITRTAAPTGAFTSLSVGVGISSYYSLYPLDIGDEDAALEIMLRRPHDWGFYLGVVFETIFMTITISTLVKARKAEEAARSHDHMTASTEAMLLKTQLDDQLKATQTRIAALEEGLAAHYPDTDLSPSDARFIAWATELIDRQMTNFDFSVRELAAQLGTSEKTLGRRVKRSTGMKPLAFIRKRKLETARDLILTNQYNTVAEFAHAVGIGNASHFAKYYRDAFGESPGEALRAAKEISE